MKLSKTMKQISAAALLVTAFTMTACNRGGGGGGAAPVASTPTFGSCSGCNVIGSGTSLFSAPAKGGPSFPVTFAFNVTGDNAIIQQILTAGWSAQKLYNGPIYVNGSFTVSSNTFAGGCQIPAGTYEMSTLQVGQMQSGSFMVPQIEAIGPTRLVFAMGPAVVVDPDANGTVDRIGAQIYFLQGPSMPVYGSTTLGGTIACGDSMGVFLN